METNPSLLDHAKWMLNWRVAADACGVVHDPDIEAQYAAHGTCGSNVHRALVDAVEIAGLPVSANEVPAAISDLRSAIDEMIPGLFIVLASRVSWSPVAIFNYLGRYYFDDGKFVAGGDLAPVLGVTPEALAGMSDDEKCIRLQTLGRSVEWCHRHGYVEWCHRHGYPLYENVHDEAPQKFSDEVGTEGMMPTGGLQRYPRDGFSAGELVEILGVSAEELRDMPSDEIAERLRDLSVKHMLSDEIVEHLHDLGFLE